MSNNLPLNLTLEQLGLTAEELGNRVVDAVVEQLATTVFGDEDGNPVHRVSPFMREMEKRIKAGVDEKVQQVAERDLLPKVHEMIEGLLIQKTNEWGEKKGEPVTFVEYLTQRADAYLREPTDWQGRAKGDPGVDSYNFRATTTRLTGLIHQHLAISIETAMKAALKELNASIAGGLEGAIRNQMAEVAKKIKVVGQVG